MDSQAEERTRLESKRGTSQREARELSGQFITEQGRTGNGRLNEHQHQSIPCLEGCTSKLLLHLAPRLRLLLRHTKTRKVTAKKRREWTTAKSDQIEGESGGGGGEGQAEAWDRQKRQRQPMDESEQKGREGKKRESRNREKEKRRDSIRRRKGKGRPGTKRQSVKGEETRENDMHLSPLLSFIPALAQLSTSWSDPSPSSSELNHGRCHCREDDPQSPRERKH